MSRANVEQSLEAVERALTHFHASLDRAGFDDGAGAYRQMAEVVMGQWLWVEQEGARDLEPRFRRVAELADSVSRQLLPYLDSMQRLSALRGLVAERWGVDPDSVAGKIIESLAAAKRPMSPSEVRATTGAPTAVVRREVGELERRGLVVRVGDHRPRYGLVREPPP